MRARWLLVCAAVALVAVPGASLAQDSGSPDVRLTLEVGEGEASCREGRTLCFQLTGGSLSEVEPGREVEITFRNTGATQHEVLVEGLTPANEDHTASESDGFYSTGERQLDPGERSTFTFEVPEDWSGIYLYCGVGGHEESGMWLSSRFSGEQAPAPGAPALLAMLAVAALLPCDRGKR